MMDRRRHILLNAFSCVEALASCEIDADGITMIEGLTNNPKLARIGVQVKKRESGEVVWRGSLADVTRRTQCR